MIQLGLNMIAETLESMDEELGASKFRTKNWVISRRDETSLLTSLGTVTYHKTLFKNKDTGACEYLLDRIMGIESHARMTEDAEAQMLEEAVDSSYRKGGLRTSISDTVSKQTVKNKIHKLKFHPKVEAVAKKKQVTYLYIDADEDHVALQYFEKKGDTGGNRNNTSMPKLAYVYKGIQPEAPKSDRLRLIQPKYFGGLYEGGTGVEQFWREINQYIHATYDIAAIKRIYINGDGAAWIKSGRKWIEKAINKRAKWMAEEAFEKILNASQQESQMKKVIASRTYILGHWSGIMEGVKNKNVQVGCRAEGHVSHIYADREEAFNRGQRYMERMNRSISYPDIKKMLWFKHHIWGL